MSDLNEFNVHVEDVADDTTVQKTPEGLTITSNIDTEIPKVTLEDVKETRQTVEAESEDRKEALEVQLAAMPDGVPPVGMEVNFPADGESEKDGGLSIAA